MVDADALSVTFIVKLDEPAAVGVPDIVLPARFRPGRKRSARHRPRVRRRSARRIESCEYAAPTIPAGNDDVVMVKAGALIVNDRAAVADARRAVGNLHRKAG